MAKQNVEKLEKEKQELEKLIPAKFKIEEEIRKEQKEKINEEKTLEILQQLEKIHNETKLEKEKINIQMKAKTELEEKLIKIEKEQKEIKQEREKPKKSKILYIIPILFLSISIGLFLMQEMLFVGISGTISIISFIMILLKNRNKRKSFEKAQEQTKMEIQELEGKHKLLKNEIKSKEIQIKETQEEIDYKEKMKLEKMKEEHPNIDKYVLESFENSSNIVEEQNYINDLKLSISKKEFEKEQIIEKLEKIVEIEEKLAVSGNTLQELIEYDEIINIAKEALEKAYLKMKENITPAFTENLSKAIYNITSRKYKNVKLNEENELMLETANRKLCNSRPFK